MAMGATEPDVASPGSGHRGDDGGSENDYTYTYTLTERSHPTSEAKTGIETSTARTKTSVLEIEEHEQEVTAEEILEAQIRQQQFLEEQLAKLREKEQALLDGDDDVSLDEDHFDWNLVPFEDDELNPYIVVDPNYESNQLKEARRRASQFFGGYDPPEEPRKKKIVIQRKWSTGPGPGQYSSGVNSIQAKSRGPKFSFGKSKRAPDKVDVDTRVMVAPDINVVKKKAQGAPAFGPRLPTMIEAQAKQKKFVPSAADYDIKDNFVRRNPGSTSFGRTTTRKHPGRKVESSLGRLEGVGDPAPTEPGAPPSFEDIYNQPLSYFGGDVDPPRPREMAGATGKRAKAEGTFYLPKVEMAKPAKPRSVWSKSRAQRFTPSKSDTPGPASYSLVQQVGQGLSNGRFSTAKRQYRDPKETSGVPGPEYNPNYNTMYRRPPRAAMRERVIEYAEESPLPLFMSNGR
eukprot:GFYU01013469.1.p1 GENE.GFYU01013469.1~~GFYU01013469.1.p1  ORF type:complete len:459 (-),score=101.67 GFYU01013469.1:109-1485(-)